MDLRYKLVKPFQLILNEMATPIRSYCWIWSDNQEFKSISVSIPVFLVLHQTVFALWPLKFCQFIQAEGMALNIKNEKWAEVCMKAVVISKFFVWILTLLCLIVWGWILLLLLLGDFGVSCLLMGSCDLATTFTGTPYYMSPEALKHQGYNTKSDIWWVVSMLFHSYTSSEKEMS